METRGEFRNAMLTYGKLGYEKRAVALWSSAKALEIESIGNLPSDPLGEESRGYRDAHMRAVSALHQLESPSSVVRHTHRENSTRDRHQRATM
mmetsp:Transcript_2702/g.3912  ORF Transcript_2702/g.3912 Transcript_2702/m.3912 type:complete len:93 (+) Transcript_2702:2-280(+)